MVALAPDRTLGDVFANLDDARIRLDVLQSRSAGTAVRAEADAFDKQADEQDHLIYNLEAEAKAMIERLTGHSFDAIYRRLA